MTKYLIVLCCFFSVIYPVSAQQADVAPPAVEEEISELNPEDARLKRPSEEVLGLNKEQVAQRPIAASQWEKSTSGVDYSKDLPAVAKKPVDRPRRSTRKLPDWDWSGMKTVFKILSVLILLILGGWVVYTLVQTPQNKIIKASDGTEITLNNLDAYIQETDLERFLREALAQNNYGLAVRLYYLQIIKALSQKEAIQWSREKTNRDYLRDMRYHPLAAEFRLATRTYEEVWYGNGELDQHGFDKIGERMIRLLGNIQ